MQEYKIDWVENVVSSKGTPYKRATLTDSSGKVVENVAVFNFYSQFNNVTPGGTVTGSLISELYNGKMSHKLEDGKTFKTFAGKPSGGITKAMEVKNTNIKEAQERKEESIQKSGAQRDAVLMVTTFYANAEWSDDELKAKIKEWYNYFLGIQDQPF